MRRLALVAAVASLALPVRSDAAVGIVAGPGAWITGYATTTVVATGGAPLLFVNADIQEHDVVSDESWAPGQGPCPPGGARCAFFRSELAATGEAVPVEGLEHVPPGTYTFRCSPHPWMDGTLIVP